GAVHRQRPGPGVRVPRPGPRERAARPGELPSGFPVLRAAVPAGELSAAPVLVSRPPGEIPEALSRGAVQSLVCACTSPPPGSPFAATTPGPPSAAAP